MWGLVVGRRMGKGRRRGLRFRLRGAETETGGVLRAWLQLPRMIWKRLSCGASGASLNRRGWRAAGMHSRYSRWCARRKKWDGTILALAGRGRNLRSATERSAHGQRARAEVRTADSRGRLHPHELSLYKLRALK